MPNSLKDLEIIIGRYIEDERFCRNYEPLVFIREYLELPDADPAIFDNKIIKYVARRGHGCEDLVNRLLSDKRVDPTAEDCQALKNAICTGRREIVKLLLAHPKFSELTINGGLKKAFEAGLKGGKSGPHVRNALKEIYWSRFRLFCIGQKDQGSILSTLPKEIVNKEFLNEFCFEFYRKSFFRK